MNTEVNIVAFVATALFIPIPTASLLILYIQTAAQSN
uniref:Photosystem II reaction center protein M n=1 Tax=Diplazium aberrans TaxID=2686441 RepID=A0A6B9MFN2_9MONI|nr:photosystem II protein M [Diplazium aberrans]